MKFSRRRTIAAVAGLAAAGAAGWAARVALARYYDGPVSDHFDGTHFFDPHGTPPKGIVDMLRWWSGPAKTQWPAWAPSPFADRPPARVAGSAWRISYVGHASLLIQTAGLNLLIDPVWSERASPFSFAGPKRVNDPGVAFDALPAIDAVLVSHNHYDHLDVATLARLAAAHRPRVVTPLGNDTVMRAHDAAIAAEPYDWHQRVVLGAGVAATLVPVRHWSARGYSTAIARCGRDSRSRPRPAASCTWPIPATARGATFVSRASVTGRSASPCCRSAPTSRAGSWVRST
jgi:hypothetical protein